MRNAMLVTDAGTIPGFADLVPVSPADDACFAELYAVLAKHGAADRFGICLLHEHFEMAPDEVLVELVDVPNRILTMQPMQQDTLDGTVLETAWRLVPGNSDDPHIIPSPTRRCVQTCVWEDGPNGRTHHTVHKWNDSPV